MSPARQSLPADDRPFDHTPIDTQDLPPTPTRDRNISAIAWKQAPEALRLVGADLDIAADAVAYKRRIGPWLLWRAGPPRGPARYIALDSADLDRSCTFTLGAERGEDHGVGPTGDQHTRFRTWKEDLLGRHDPAGDES